MDEDGQVQPSRLRTVFDAFDVDKKGYITVDHFVGLAKEHFGAEDQEEAIRRIIKLLDPSDEGHITFTDFCSGIQQITQLTSPSTPPAKPFPSIPSFSSEDTVVAAGNHDEQHDVSEVSTYNEYDMMTDDDQSNHIGSSSGLGSDDNANDSKSEDSKEAQKEATYEYVSPASNMDCDSDKPFTRASSIRLSARRAAGSGYAGHLLRNSSFRSASSATHSRRSSCSDEYLDDIDGSFTELNDKVRRLEGELEELREKQHKSDKTHVRMKDENHHLIERINLLEEQVREAELRSQEQLELERKKHQDAMSKSDKEKSQEIEFLTESLQIIKRDYTNLKEEVPLLRSENERLKRECAQLDERLETAQESLEELQTKHSEVTKRHEDERQAMDQERLCHGQLLDELTKELEELRIYRSEHPPSLGRSTSQQLDLSQRQEYEKYIVQLKEQLAHLHEQNEDLQSQILGHHVLEGRQLVQNGGQTLASELQDLPRDELLKTLKEEKVRNQKLTDYIDKMTVKIMEKNPGLLEV